MGEAGFGYSLGKDFFLPEFAFSVDELDALVLGLTWVQQRADPALAQSSESALAKILAATGDSSLASVSPPALAPAASLSERVDAPEAALMRGAIRRQRKASIHYADACGFVSERTIWPIAIVYFDDVRILAAWCERRSAFRHFRIDRLCEAKMLKERYPGRRQDIMERWRRQDRDWRSILTVSDRPAG